ncbi:MAG: RAMP superfamily CRISPR-associated protein, partial [Syntrophus sp. (in: bacteria)]
MIHHTHAVRCHVLFEAKTGLLIRSGREGTFTDSAIECDPEGRLHINGYVWASLLRRAVDRLVGGELLAKSWGKMPQEEMRVSPLWTEASFIAKQNYEPVVNPGIRINREWGVTDEGALYNDEMAIPIAPISCRFTLFCASKEVAEAMKGRIADLLWVIGQGIETVGGGWAYGFGRLQPLSAHLAVLDLQIETGRLSLWQPSFNNWETPFDKDALAERRPQIAPEKGWRCLEVAAGVADGQLLAIHATIPPLTGELPADMPDRFVFARPRINSPTMTAVPVLTGKAFRQAVLSREIERILRTTGEGACLNTSEEKRTPVIPIAGSKEGCHCKRCLWFGDTHQAGIVSVGDTEIDEPRYETIHRIALCEHSMQNINLFSFEYLTRGRFNLRILIDHPRGKDADAKIGKDCEEAIAALLNGMMRD